MKGAAVLEGKILTDVVKRARQGDFGPGQRRTISPIRPRSRRSSQAQKRLSGSLAGCCASDEAYPQLQSQATFRTLMDQIEGTNNRITDLGPRLQHGGAGL